jgi:hypothetical protein
VIRIKIEGERVGGGVWGWLDLSSLGTPDTRKLYVKGLLTEDIVLWAGSGVFPPPRPSLMCLGIVVIWLLARVCRSFSILSATRRTAFQNALLP